MTTHERDLILRAETAYTRATRRAGYVPVIPSNQSAVLQHEGREYVVLVNTNGILAVYRVRTSGLLKALKRWPAAINDWYA